MPMFLPTNVNDRLTDVLKTPEVFIIRNRGDSSDKLSNFKNQGRFAVYHAATLPMKDLLVAELFALV